MALPTPVDQKPQMAPPAKKVKEQGCFQCSRRRVVCDKGEPACMKCIKKGIECSGLGRIRFAEGVARRGRFKDCKVPAIGDGLQEGGGVLPTCVPPTLTWPEDRRSAKRKKREDNKDVTVTWSREVAVVKHTPVTKESSTTPPDRCIPPNRRTPPRMLAVQPRTSSSEEEDVEEIIRPDMVLERCRSPSNTVRNWLAPVDPTSRMLFSYYAEAVAPAMVLLDDEGNGYRSLVLPMALQDDILRRAVSVVATQHLSLKRPELRPVAEAGRTAIISRLYKNSLGGSADQVFNQFTWTTLIVLLVGETVTGSADFGFLVQMLLSLSANSVFGNMDSEVMNFLQAQTNLFELLGVPLLGEEIGMLTIMKASELLMKFLWFPNLPEDSEDRIMADMVRQCFISACAIYTRCATNSTADPMIDLIQKNAIDQLIEVMKEIPTSFRGSHALVWVCFVAGAETTDEAQRAFFVDRMRKTHERTGFRNIPLSIKSLENIWSRKTNERWTLCLPQLSNVLVM